ncbi:Fic family protein [Pelagibaculum spongiae]|uniref:Fido domain-containing protein n=1 Tax=Pelagibaculum spongiae TaxID=2080658 RepID=A0A2V1GXQ8_9GAMM|nr:Fic family protein [Pelagibaculum spongiae]PVZ66655.1 hypothetical protein DC094_15405 [Pelagibaculum spongiae]
MLGITPFISSDRAGELADLAARLIQLDAELHRMVPGSIRGELESLLSFVNSYYSNRIEGNGTRPADILAATEQVGTESRHELLEVLTCAEVESLAASGDFAKPDPSGETLNHSELVSRFHRAFYKKLPEKFCEIKHPTQDTVLTMIPGVFRQHDVMVGSHKAPDHHKVICMMNGFTQMYRFKNFHGLDPILAIAALHHRLVWIHPFLDGNGRVARLYTGYLLQNSILKSHGLWSINRGFSKQNEKYRQALAMADRVRQGGSDGRGLLSDNGLKFFTQFFLETAIDQIEFFIELFSFDKLLSRVRYYFDQRHALPQITTSERQPIHKSSGAVYLHLLKEGVQTREQLCKYLGVSDKTLRTILKSMQAAKLVYLEDRQPVRPRLASDALEIFFPSMW